MVHKRSGGPGEQAVALTASETEHGGALSNSSSSPVTESRGSTL